MFPLDANVWASKVQVEETNLEFSLVSWSLDLGQQEIECALPSLGPLNTYPATMLLDNLRNG